MNRDDLKVLAIKISIPTITIALSIIVTVIIFVTILNPFTPRGEITGIFVEGSHKGYGDFCGDYPHTIVRFHNVTYIKEHFYGGHEGREWFMFDNQWTDLDNMIVGQKYRIWYHQEYRPSDTTSGDSIRCWMIDDIKLVEGGS